MAISSLSLSLFSLIYVNILNTKAHDCGWSPGNATYDLEKLVITASNKVENRGYYEVFDNRGYSAFNFTYLFNICENMLSPPKEDICINNTKREQQLMATGYCSDRNETDGSCLEVTDIEPPIAAYQVKRQIHYNNVNHTEEIFYDCWRLHNGDEEQTKWSFIDSDDPSIGVRLSYYSGDWCQAAFINREFHLEFYCDEVIENIPDRKEEIIFEDEICSYVLPIYTSYGCPTECPISSVNNKLCDGHGICEFDYTNKKPQCYCYYGYCGDDCSKTNCGNEDLYNVTAPNDEDSCTFELTDSFGIKAHYNLSYFNVKGENWQVDDYLDREYVYKFQICGNMESFSDETQIPSQCVNDVHHGPCTHWIENEYTYNNKTSVSRYCDNTYDTSHNSVAKAIQLYYPKNSSSEVSCYWLGMDLPDNFNMPSFDVSLIDKNDSGRGIQFTIQNGQYCREGDSNRQLIVKLQCPDSRGYEFDPEQEAKSIINETVLESETCIYELSLESPLACPFQCISSKGDNTYAVCGSHGICASDPSANAIRCICDAGWTGIRCNVIDSGMSTTGNPETTGNPQTTQSSSDNNNNGGGGGGDGSSSNGVYIGLVIGIVVLFIAIFAGWTYWKKWKQEGQIGYARQLNDGGLIGDNGVEAGQ